MADSLAPEHESRQSRVSYPLVIVPGVTGATPQSSPSLRADLVLEGGGVKGFGLVGAVTELASAGYAFPRVAGTSAGAVVAAFLAALQRAGEPLTRLEDVAASIHLGRFRDRGPIARHAGPLSPVVDAFSLIAEGGVFEGDYARSWLAGALGDLGVRTFGDLRLPDPGSHLPIERQHALVVTASDLSRRRLARFPWDYRDYGVDPDEQSVADAVRAAVSIPYFFEPVRLRDSTLVDGTLLSNFPIALFDRTDGRRPRWPTFGVRLSARRHAGPALTRAVSGPVSMALAIVETALQACDAQHADEVCVQARTVFVDATGVSPVDFSLSDADRSRLVESGRSAARDFLDTWDFTRYLAECREFES